MTTGIYIILNTVNNHKYIGQSKNIESRWVGHVSSLRKGKHANPHFQNAWNKYGEDLFGFQVLEECEPNCLDEREQYWIERLKPQYNISLNVYDWQRYQKNKSYIMDDEIIPKDTFIRPSWHRQVYGDGQQERVKGRNRTQRGQISTHFAKT